MFLSNNPSSGDINSLNLSCFNFIFLLFFSSRTLQGTRLCMIVSFVMFRAGKNKYLGLPIRKKDSKFVFFHQTSPLKNTGLFVVLVKTNCFRTVSTSEGLVGSPEAQVSYFWPNYIWKLDHTVDGAPSQIPGFCN